MQTVNVTRTTYLAILGSLGVMTAATVALLAASYVTTTYDPNDDDGASLTTCRVFRVGTFELNACKDAVQ